MSCPPIGCTDYRVIVMTRGGGTAVMEVPWTQISWSRLLDETSSARVIAGGSGRDCCEECEDLLNVRPWRNELAIFRGGQAVWIGPIVSLAVEDSDISIEARDLSAWLGKRLIHQDHFLFGVDLVTIFTTFVADALAPDPSPNINVISTPSGILGDREVLATSFRICEDEIGELARTGVDWTCVLRDLTVAGQEIQTPPIGLLVDEHFVEVPQIEIDGSVQTNSVTVTGSGGGAYGENVFATQNSPPAVINDFGLLERVDSEAEIIDFGSVAQAAQTRLDRDAVPIAFIRSGRVVPDAPLDIDDLIPGARVIVQLSSPCIPVAGTFRLSGVDVEVSNEESITLTFQPIGTFV